MIYYSFMREERLFDASTFLCHVGKGPLSLASPLKHITPLIHTYVINNQRIQYSSQTWPQSSISTQTNYIFVSW